MSNAVDVSFFWQIALDHGAVAAARSLETPSCRAECPLKSSLAIRRHVPQEQRHDQNSLFSLDVARLILTCFEPGHTTTKLLSSCSVCCNVYLAVWSHLLTKPNSLLQGLYIAHSAARGWILHPPKRIATQSGQKFCPKFHVVRSWRQ